jgi:hypothetical protein
LNPSKSEIEIMRTRLNCLILTGVAVLLAASSAAWAIDEQARARIDSSGAGADSVAVTENPARGGGILADFGTREVGTTVRAMLGYSSVGEAPITNIVVGSITGPGAVAFEIFDENCTGATLPPGSQCVITVDFSPPAAGLFEAQFEVTSTSVNSPEVVFLVGRGIVDKMFNDRFEVDSE